MMESCLITINEQIQTALVEANEDFKLGAKTISYVLRALVCAGGGLDSHIGYLKGSDGKMSSRRFYGVRRYRAVTHAIHPV